MSTDTTPGLHSVHGGQIAECRGRKDVVQVTIDHPCTTDTIAERLGDARV